MVKANWYAGNELSSVFGVWAKIYTPYSPPYIVPSNYNGQANWVSTPGPNWIQTGWTIVFGESTPDRYVETCINECWGGRYYVEFGNQSWGSGIDYQIEWIPGTPDTWCAFIDNVQRKCQPIRSAPSDVQINSEIQQSPLNGLHTDFSDVHYKASDNQWRLSTQSNYRADFPYNVDIFSSYSFQTNRLQTSEVYLPIISNP